MARNRQPLPSARSEVSCCSKLEFTRTAKLIETADKLLPIAAATSKAKTSWDFDEDASDPSNSAFVMSAGDSQTSWREHVTVTGSSLLHPHPPVGKPLRSR
jgi:hypothetical protein